MSRTNAAFPSASGSGSARRRRWDPSARTAGSTAVTSAAGTALRGTRAARRARRGGPDGRGVEEEIVQQEAPPRKQPKLHRVGRWGRFLAAAPLQQQPRRTTRIPAAATSGDASQELSWQQVWKQSSMKELREEESYSCLGGQRIPRSSLLKVPGARAVGLLIRVAFEVFWGKHTTESGASFKPSAPLMRTARPVPYWRSTEVSSDRRLGPAWI